MRIMIIGSPGSGKSTYTRRMSQRLNYPIFYLDRYWHQTDYSMAAKKHLDFLQAEFMRAHQNCIVDGNYSSLMPTRMKQADLIIWLRVPRVIAIKRVINRSVRGRFFQTERPDMAANFSEHFDWEYVKFMKFIWDYPRHNYHLVERLRQQYAPQTPLVILHGKSEKDAFLAKLATIQD